MSSLPHHLPPLSALRFFEAAGRHQSFKLAAAELNVTPSAVSHGIVNLEQSLGVALFVRAPRKLTLTATGIDYLRHISDAFARIDAGTREVSRHAGRRDAERIAVTCAPTVAARWLLPRLADFRRRWPHTNVVVDTSLQQVDLPAAGFDFAIRMSRSALADSSWVRLFSEQLTPMCCPAYRNERLDPHGHFDWRRATLIHVSPASEDWPAWLAHAGMDDLDVSAGLRFDTIQMAFDAAAAGLGVVLGRRPLVDRELAAQTLVELDDTALAADTAYWLVSAHGAHRPDQSGFKHWLLQQARASAAVM